MKYNILAGLSAMTAFLMILFYTEYEIMLGVACLITSLIYIAAHHFDEADESENMKWYRKYENIILASIWLMNAIIWFA